MADASRHAPPPGWDDAFAGLPLASPPTSRWSQIDAALQARAGHAAPRGGQRAWRALAASLLALALLPVAWLALERGPTGPAATTTAPDRTTPDRTVAVVASPSAAQPVPPAVPRVAATATVSDANDVEATTPPSTPNVPADPRTSPVRERDAARTDAGDARALATASPPRRDWPQARVALPTPGTGPDRSAPERQGADMQASFESLYADGAELERLLAFARDTRVASGPEASLAAALDSEIAAIDTRLAQPDLSAGQRLELWRHRVDLLRQSALLESQFRLLAAEGSRLDGAPAEIH